MLIQNLISQAKKKEAFELLISPDQCPRIRLKSSWQPLDLAHLSSPETRKILLSFLSEEDKKILSQGQGVEGFWSLSGQNFYYQIQISASGLIGQISWLPEEIKAMSFWNFPQWTKESLARGRGLHILIGKNKLALEASAVTLLTPIVESYQKFIVWMKPITLSTMTSDQSVISYLQSESIPESADLVVIEGYENSKKAFECSEKGQSVLLLLTHHDLTQALEKISSAERLSHQLKWAMSIKLIHGVDGWTAAYDLLAVTPVVKELLRESKLQNLESWMNDNHLQLKEGMRNMNQSLLQLVLKRKIELKQGFEESPEPEQLDQLLKKVGF